MKDFSLSQLRQQSSQWLWKLGIFTAPFNISLLLWQPLFSTGYYNPYISVSLFLSEILILLAFCLSWKRNKITKKTKAILLITLGLILWSIHFAENQLGATLNSLHLLTGIAIVRLIQKNIIPLKEVKKWFVYSITLQATFGMLQFAYQHSLGLHWLGEAWINPESSGIAKTPILGGKPLLRAYGTFAHANILAAFSLVAFLWRKSIPQKHQNLITLILLGGILFSFSKAVFLTGILLWIIHPHTKHKFAVSIGLLIALRLFMPILSTQETIQERLQYNAISIEMLVHEPQGVGFHQFTDRMQEFTTEKLQPWQFQPVHNIYLLMANEFGIIGVLLILTMLFKHLSREKSTFIALIILGLFDHYFLSLYPGIFLAALILGISLHPKELPMKSG